jgi:K+-sensing histidine kinase KdpD
MVTGQDIVHGEKPVHRLQSQLKRRPDMILVPFRPTELTPEMIKSAVDKAERTSAELVFLCVCPPRKSIRYAKECEQLYSNLKGLQAQLASRSVRVKIEAVVGPVAQFVLDYADEQGSEMIVIPGKVLAAGPHPIV